MVHVGNPLFSVEGLLHAGFFIVFAGVTGYLIYKWFFYFPAHEQDQYYLRGGGAQKMVRLKGKPQKVGDIYWKYTAELYIDNQRLGADMEKVGLSFERVSDQDVEVDPKTSGRYPIEKFGQPGIVEFIEVEGSEIDLLLKKNLDRDTPFEFILKGPYGQYKYTGKGSFFEYFRINLVAKEPRILPRVSICSSPRKRTCRHSSRC